MHSFLLTSFKQKYSDDFSAWPSESHTAEICRTTQPQLSAVQHKTQLWLYYMDMIWLVLRFLRATKENNLDLHLACLQEMCPLLFSMDHMNYAKYLSVCFISLLNIKHTHPGADRLLRDGGFSVSRSDVTTSRNAVDQTIEQTINRHAKSHGGIVGFSRNVAAYYRWCVTRPMRGSFLAAAMELAGMTDEEETNHKGVFLLQQWSWQE